MSENLHQMTPLEAVTHLFTCLKLADGRIDFEERESWADAISDLFPDHSPARSLDFLQDATRALLAMGPYARRNYAVRLCSILKEHFTEEKLQQEIGPKIASIVESDGMVFSSEKEMVEDIKKELGIEITLRD